MVGKVADEGVLQPLELAGPLQRGQVLLEAPARLRAYLVGGALLLRALRGEQRDILGAAIDGGVDRELPSVTELQRVELQDRLAKGREVTARDGAPMRSLGELVQPLQAAHDAGARREDDPVPRVDVLDESRRHRLSDLAQPDLLVEGHAQRPAGAEDERDGVLVSFAGRRSGPAERRGPEEGQYHGTGEIHSP